MRSVSDDRVRSVPCNPAQGSPLKEEAPPRLSGVCPPEPAAAALLSECVQPPDEDWQTLGEARPTSP